jgi:hypothetical protein
MKKYCLFFIFLITFSCKDDLPNQFTSVEGIVTDYYSKLPVSDIPVIVIDAEDWCFMDCDDIVLDTIFTNQDGYYHYEFFNDSNRYYTIEIIQSEFYYSGSQKIIIECKKDIINYSIKPFRTLTLNCFNQSNTFNRLSVFSYLNMYEFSCNQCEKLTVVDFKILPEYKNEFNIRVFHYNEEDKSDTSKSYNLMFFSGINDTTINYYY